MKQLIISYECDSRGLIEICGKDFHYLRHVLRYSVGDMVRVLTPNEGALNTTICRIDDKKKILLLQKCNVVETQNALPSKQTELNLNSNVLPRAPIKFYLFQMIPKPQKMELIVRQATECGVNIIVPVLGEYTQAGCEKALLKKDERFSKIINEARKQSGSPINTTLLSPMQLEDAVDFWHKECSNEKPKCSEQTTCAPLTASILLYERTENTINIKTALATFSAEATVKSKTASNTALLQENTQIKRAALFVGCEGGISLKEYDVLTRAGFCAVHLETNILRCETAALYGIATLQSFL